MTQEKADWTGAIEDLKIMGDLTRPGGRWRNISVMGDLRLEGDVRAVSFRCMGDATVTGSFQSQKVGIMGDTTFRGTVECGELNIMGEVVCLADLRTRKLSCMGDLDIAGTLNADDVRIMGAMIAGGDCNADRFDSRGTFRIAGLLSVDQLRVVPWGASSATEIGGSSIVVRRRWGMLGTLRLLDVLKSLVGLPYGAHRLETNSIEGDEIDLEDVVATVVRGNKVRIGKGCRIGRVEHKKTFRRHPDAEVGEIVQV